MYIGIDNGVSGGMCALSHPHGQVMGFLPMPVKKVDGTREVDVRKVLDWLVEATGDDLWSATYIIEKPHGSKSAKAAQSMAGSFHSLRAIFDLKGLKFKRVTCFEWQKAILDGNSETKIRAILKARELWPRENFMPGRCKKAHDGIVDAALIAEYARREGLK